MNIIVNSIIETVSSWTLWQTIVCVVGSITLPILGRFIFMAIVNTGEHKKNKHCVWEKHASLFAFKKEHKKETYKENWL